VPESIAAAAPRELSDTTPSLYMPESNYDGEAGRLEDLAYDDEQDEELPF
jgi:hypothetical protein